MQNKINKIMQLLGCEHLSENTQKLVNITLQKMIESHKIGNEKLYRANEADLWQYIGAVRLNESILQDLHEKILFCVETAIKGSSDRKVVMNENFAKTLQIAKQLHEMYYPKQEIKVDKVDKYQFKWEKF